MMWRSTMSLVLFHYVYDSFHFLELIMRYITVSLDRCILIDDVDKYFFCSLYLCLQLFLFIRINDTVQHCVAFFLLLCLRLFLFLESMMQCSTILLELCLEIYDAMQHYKVWYNLYKFCIYKACVEWHE